MNEREGEVDREREAKLRLGAEDYDRFRQRPRLLWDKSWRVLEENAEEIDNIYFDTPDEALHLLTAVLRARRIEGVTGVEWTFKLAAPRSASSGAGRSITDSEELIEHLPSDSLEIETAGKSRPVTRAASLAGRPETSFRQMDRNRVSRRTFVLEGESGKIALSLDRLLVVSPDASRPDQIDYELEVEDWGAGGDALEAFAGRLIARYGLSPSAAGKRSRTRAARLGLAIG